MIPTALSGAETQLLRDLGRNRLVYEAGALLGASTVALAQHARLVVSVDPHEGYPRRDPSSTWLAFQDNLAKAGVAHRVQAVQARFEDAPPTFDYGLAFADLTGEHDLTRTFLQATRHIRRVAVHDYARPGCEGATVAINDFIIATRPRWVERVDSLILLTR